MVSPPNRAIVDFWSVWTLNDDGLATRLEFYLDHQQVEALESAGLSQLNYGDE